MGILRVLLAIAVILDHSTPIFGLTLTGGKVAVQSFYIISGFYMSLILNEKYIDKNSSYKLFITNRILRLYPVYYTVVILILFISFMSGIFSGGKNWMWLSPYLEFSEIFKPGSFIFLIVSNTIIFGQDICYFLGFDKLTGSLYFTENFRTSVPQTSIFLFIPQAWTISLEMMFYLVAPFIVKRNFKIILLLIVCSFGIRFFLINAGLNNDPWTYRFFPNEIALFLLGAISYRIYKKIRNIYIWNFYAYSILTFIFLITIFYGEFSFEYKDFIYFFLIFLLVPFIFLTTKDSKIDGYIGELSYPMYICHLFIFWMIVYVKMPAPGGLGIALTVTTIIFSIFLNEFVAKKVERFRQRRLNS